MEPFGAMHLDFTIADFCMVVKTKIVAFREGNLVNPIWSSRVYSLLTLFVTLLCFQRSDFSITSKTGVSGLALFFFDRINVTCYNMLYFSQEAKT